MKKIIGGHKYDTETARCVGVLCANCGVSDFSYYEEKLYKKRTGEFFLYGCGNAASKYSRSCGMNEWRGDSCIIPFSEEQARAWAEKALDADGYEAIFGEVSE